ncbi:RNA polymerase sigma factor [Patulibacter defluvii]|uniref:RNA polymerase sigma factor n=1 Tax=Patulibacter defluvii TaxID=3095358 RepID=UPI002A755529|nr:sigma-70 family RNA polymerase sigma factor [Patulibacter sp. DM4]
MGTKQLTAQDITELFDAYATRVQAFCQRVLGCPAAAEDATQETFLNLLRRQPAVRDDPDALRTYVFATARNACCDLLRRRRAVLSLDALAEAGDRAADPVSTDPRHDPERRALSSELRGDLLTALRAIPPRQAEVMVMRVAEDLTYHQIADRIDSNANNVAQMLHRARRNLNQALQPVAV